MQSTQKTTANDFPLYLFHQGKNFEAHKFFGAHPFRRGRGQFYRFRVWAPHAKSVSVIGSFNQWDRTCHPMYKISDTVWEAELPRLKQFDSYKYSIETEDGQILDNVFFLFKQLCLGGPQLAAGKEKTRPLQKPHEHL